MKNAGQPNLDGVFDVLFQARFGVEGLLVQGGNVSPQEGRSNLAVAQRVRVGTSDAGEFEGTLQALGSVHPDLKLAGPVEHQATGFGHLKRVGTFGKGPHLMFEMGINRYL